MNPSGFVIYQLLFMGLVQIEGKTFKAARKLPGLPVTNNNLFSNAQCQKRHRPMREEHLQQSYENTHLEIKRFGVIFKRVCFYTNSCSQENSNCTTDQ